MNLPRLLLCLRRCILSLVVLAIAFPPAPAVAAGVHPGDKLDVVVFDHPDLSGPLTVSNIGAIFVPLVGQVQAVGLQPQEIARNIERQLAQYVVSPAVDVRVVSESNTAYFVGVSTASITLHPAETLAMAVGGATLPTSADLSSVALLRDGATVGTYNLVTMQTQIDSTPLLASGDTINVPAKPIVVRVAGAVKQPATVFLARDEPLGLALQSVQPADNANLQQIQVVRGGDVRVTSRSSAMLAAPGVSGDQLIVPPFANVTVLGFASKPGPVVLKGDQSLATALTQAGGAAKGADLGRIVVISGDGSGRERMIDYNAFTRGDASGNTQLADGDMVYVPKQQDRISPKTLLAIALIVAKKAGLDLAKLLK